MEKEDIEKIVRLGYSDTAFFLKFFLLHWYPAPFSWAHYGIMAIMDRKTDFLLKYLDARGLDKLVRHFVTEEGEPLFIPVYEDGVLTRIDMVIKRNTLVIMPRGFAKTTLINGCMIKNICYRDRKFPVYISETQTHAETQLRNVKNELESNERILFHFGEVKPEQRSGKKWTESIIELTTGVTLAARGRGGQIRGMNVNAQRPDMIVIDDVEDKESVATQEQRDKTKDWAYGDLMPALPRMDDRACIVAVGTLLHSDALLMTWLRDPDWTSIKLGAIDKDGEPIWSENMNLAKIEATKQGFARAGRLHLFYLEFMNEVRNPENALFKNPPVIVGGATDKLQKALACDPAISTNKKACMFSLVTVGMEQGGRIHILDAWGKVGVNPREQVNRFFDMYLKWLPEKTGVEAIAYQAALVHLLQEEMFRRHTYFKIEKIGHGRQRKIDRVEGILAPRYSAGYIVARAAFPELNAQLLDWPNGLMDLPDTLAMAIALLDPYAAMAADPSKDLAEDQYDPLDDTYFSQVP